MPEKWVDVTLTGAMAVAFRVNSIGSMSCGLGRTENACWPVVNCQMDIYVDSTAPLPWKYPEIRRDFLMNGVASDEYLFDINDDKRRRRYVPKEASQPLRFGVLGSIQWNSLPGRVLGSITSPDVNYFDRDLYPGVTLLSFNQLCPAKSGRSVLSFTSLDDYRKLLSNEIDPGAVRPVHLIEIPDQFTRRAWVAYERDSQALNEASKRLMQDFFEKRPGGKKP